MTAFYVNVTLDLFAAIETRSERRDARQGFKARGSPAVSGGRRGVE